MATFIDGFEQFKDDPMELMPLAGYSTTEMFTSVGHAPESSGIGVPQGVTRRSFERENTSGKVSAGVAARFSGRGNDFFRLNGFGISASKTTGRLKFGGIEGKAIPAADVFYYYEIELDPSAETATVFINGKEEGTVPYTTDVPAETDVAISSAYDPPEGSGDGRSYTVLFDDLYIKDGERLGPIDVLTQTANENSSPQGWEPSVPEASHAEMVGIQPPDRLNKYVQSDGLGDEDVYTSSTVASRDGPVLAAKLVSLARVTSGSDKHLTVLQAGTPSETEELGSNYAYQYTDVDAAGQTVNSMGGTSFGVKVSPL